MSYYNQWIHAEQERSKEEAQWKWETEKYTFIKGLLIVFAFVCLVGMGLLEGFDMNVNGFLEFLHIPYVMTNDEFEGIKAIKLLIPLLSIYCLLFYFFSGTRIMKNKYIKNVQKEVQSEFKTDEEKEDFAKAMLEAKNGAYPIILYEKSNERYEYICTDKYIFAKSDDYVQIVKLLKVNTLELVTVIYGKQAPDHDINFCKKNERNKNEYFIVLSSKSQEVRNNIVDIVLDFHPNIRLIHK